MSKVLQKVLVLEESHDSKVQDKLSYWLKEGWVVVSISTAGAANQHRSFVWVTVLLKKSEE